MVDYKALRRLARRSRDAIGGTQQAKEFLRTDWKGTAVGSRMVHEAGESVVPWELAKSSDEGLKKVLDYLDEHEGRLNGEIISPHIR